MAGLGLTLDGQGGASFDAGAAARLLKLDGGQAAALGAVSAVVSDKSKSALDVYNDVLAGGLALGPEAAPFIAFAAALPQIAMAIDGLFPEPPAVTHYPQWVSPQDAWSHVFAPAQQQWGSPTRCTFDDPKPGSFEAYFYGTLWSAMQKAHDAGKGGRGGYAGVPTQAELSALLAITLDAWNSSHAPSPSRTVSRDFTQWSDPTGWSAKGAPQMIPSACDPVSQALPAPPVGTNVVRFVVNEGPHLIELSEVLGKIGFGSLSGAQPTLQDKAAPKKHSTAKKVVATLSVAALTGALAWGLRFLLP